MIQGPLRSERNEGQEARRGPRTGHRAVASLTGNQTGTSMEHLLCAKFSYIFHELVSGPLIHEQPGHDPSRKVELVMGQPRPGEARQVSMEPWSRPVRTCSEWPGR